MVTSGPSDQLGERRQAGSFREAIASRGQAFRKRETEEPNLLPKAARLTAADRFVSAGAGAAATMRLASPQSRDRQRRGGRPPSGGREVMPFPGGRVLAWSCPQTPLARTGKAGVGCCKADLGWNRLRRRRKAGSWPPASSVAADATCKESLAKICLPVLRNRFRLLLCDCCYFDLAPFLHELLTWRPFRVRAVGRRSAARWKFLLCRRSRCPGAAEVSSPALCFARD